jgi:hypothetical protein
MHTSKCCARSAAPCRRGQHPLAAFARATLVVDEADGLDLSGRLVHLRTDADDHAVWATQATAAPWICESGLAVDTAGFVARSETLESVSHADVFGA